jgi:hypothetical protein
VSDANQHAADGHQGLRGEVSTRVYDALCDSYGESQQRRYRGCFVSQSLREVMAFLDAEQIIEVVASRNPTETGRTVALPESFGHFTDETARYSTAVSQKYDRHPHQAYPWADIREWLDDREEIHDLAVSRLVFRMDHDALRDHLYKLLNTAVGFTDDPGFKIPFYVVMESRKADEPKLRRAVKDYHSDRYFTTGETADGERGLGWNKRTLDLAALWSHRAFTKSGGPVLGRLSMYELEDMAFNHVGTSRPEYGVIHSKLAINRWASEFSSGTTDTKAWDWEDRAGWVRADGDER